MIRSGKVYAFGAEGLKERICDVTSCESYIDGIWNKDIEDEWLTEITISSR